MVMIKIPTHTRKEISNRTGSVCPLFAFCVKDVQYNHYKLHYDGFDYDMDEGVWVKDRFEKYEREEYINDLINAINDLYGKNHIVSEKEIKQVVERFIKLDQYDGSKSKEIMKREMNELEEEIKSNLDKKYSEPSEFKERWSKTRYTNEDLEGLEYVYTSWRVEFIFASDIEAEEYMKKFSYRYNGVQTMVRPYPAMGVLKQLLLDQYDNYVENGKEINIGGGSRIIVEKEETKINEEND